MQVRVNINLVSFNEADAFIIMPLPNPAGFKGDPCVAVMASALVLHLFDVGNEFPPFRKAFFRHSLKSAKCCVCMRAADFPTFPISFKQWILPSSLKTSGTFRAFRMPREVEIVNVPFPRHANIPQMLRDVLILKRNI